MAQGERWGFEGGVVPQAAKEPGRPTRSYGEGFGGVGDEAKVSERRLVNDFGDGMKQFGPGLGGVGLGGHASGLLEESLDVDAPPDGFAGVATPVSPPLEIRRV